MVPEEPLHLDGVPAVAEEDRCRRVPERVRARLDARPPCRGLHGLEDLAVLERRPVRPCEDQRVVGGTTGGLASVPERPRRRRGERYVSAPVPGLRRADTAAAEAPPDQETPPAEVD